MAKFGVEKLAEEISEQILAESLPALERGVSSGFWGSPIEGIFAIALEWHVRVFDGYYHPFSHIVGGDSNDQHALVLKRQEIILEGWPVDFLIYPKVCPNRCIVVECDGHAFHERTKEQAARDRSRDRALQERGFVVYRFTGSEIYRDPGRCAKEVLEKAFEFWRAATDKR